MKSIMEMINFINVNVNVKTIFIKQITFNIFWYARLDNLSHISGGEIYDYS